MSLIAKIRGLFGKSNETNITETKVWFEEQPAAKKQPRAKTVRSNQRPNHKTKQRSTPRKQANKVKTTKTSSTRKKNRTATRTNR